jgi:hypothetical protein
MSAHPNITLPWMPTAGPLTVPAAVNDQWARPDEELYAVSTARSVPKLSAAPTNSVPAASMTSAD